MWFQKTLSLQPKIRGMHLITHEVRKLLPELATYEMGLAHLFLLHTSAALTINENADPDVRGDLERHLDILVPENAPHYQHTLEGPDDLPAHVKSSLMGVSLTLPIRQGDLFMGTWQGLYLCEFRNDASGRQILVTLQGTA